MDSFQFAMPTKLYCGPDSLKMLPELCSAFGDKLLLVTSADLAHAEKSVLDALGRGASVETFHIEASEPTVAFIDASAAELRSKKFDCIIGVGGGSAIDMAKALSIALTESESIWMYANLSNRPPLPLENSPIPVIAIPTTSGTGSEVTPYAVLTNSETKQKGTIQEPVIFPTAALLDPALTVTMPAHLTAQTGIDALTHAMESYINISKLSPVSEWAGREAVRIIFRDLPRVLKEPEDLELRSAMSWASSLAGIAIAHRGTTAIHAIAEPLGALTHLPHASAVAICTLPVLKHTGVRGEKSFSELFDAISSANGLPNAQKSSAFIERTDELLNTVGVNKRVSECVGPDASDGLAESLLDNVMEYKYRPLKQHPEEFDRDVISKIISEII